MAPRLRHAENKLPVCSPESRVQDGFGPYSSSDDSDQAPTPRYSGAAAAAAAAAAPTVPRPHALFAAARSRATLRSMSSPQGLRGGIGMSPPPDDAVGAGHAAASPGGGEQSPAAARILSWQGPPMRLRPSLVWQGRLAAGGAAAHLTGDSPPWRARARAAGAGFRLASPPPVTPQAAGPGWIRRGTQRWSGGGPY